MDGRNIEPRTVLWAVAEVSWEDQGGTPNCTSATLEDTSPSGACIRLKTPIQVGSWLTVKWHREQFSAVARNCRSDGRDFLLGVRKEIRARGVQVSKPSSSEDSKTSAKVDLAHPAPKTENSAPPPKPKQSELRAPTPVPATPIAVAQAPAPANAPPAPNSPPPAVQYPAPAPRAQPHISGSSPRQERKVMHSKGLFPKFWRSQQDGTDAPTKPEPTEAPVKQSHTNRPEGITGQQQTDLLSYEDIYHAAGILSPRSGYGVHKVVDMLNSDRIRELSKDIKRASVLMALDAAGTSPDDLLQDATRRQQALNSYEAGQQKQLEESEARKAQEDTRIQAEMERVNAHCAERLKQNHDQVAREKEALRNWQMAKQHEMLPSPKSSNSAPSSQFPIRELPRRPQVQARLPSRRFLVLPNPAWHRKLPPAANPTSPPRKKNVGTAASAVRRAQPGEENNKTSPHCSPQASRVDSFRPAFAAERHSRELSPPQEP